MKSTLPGLIGFIREPIEALAERACFGHRWLTKAQVHPTLRFPGPRGVVKRRAVLLSMFAGIAVTTFVPGTAFAKLVHDTPQAIQAAKDSGDKSIIWSAFGSLLRWRSGTPVAPPGPIQKIGVSGGYNGTVGSGYGGIYLAEPTPSVARALNAPVRPQCVPMFANFQSCADDTTLGFDAEFTGKVGGSPGLATVKVICEGVSLTIPTKSSFTYASPYDQTFNTLITNFLYHFIIDKTVAGTRRFYLEAIANDGSADPQIVGPFLFTVDHSLVAAPWGGPKSYDWVKTFGASGQDYTTPGAAFSAGKTAGKSALLLIAHDNGGFSQDGYTGGVANATQLWTIAGDPRSITTGCWPDNHLDSGGPNEGWQPGCDGLRFLGSSTKIDNTLLSSSFGVLGPGSGGGTQDSQYMVLEGVEIFSGSGSGSPSYTAWNGVSGAGALFAGGYAGNAWLHTFTSVFFGECYAHDTVYGFVNQSGGSNIARNCTSNRTFKVHQGFARGSYNCTVYNTGLYNNPNAVALGALSVYCTTAGSTVRSLGGFTGNTTALVFTESGTDHTYTIGPTDTWATVAAFVNAISANWHATNLATTPQTSRSISQAWGGQQNQPTTVYAYNAAITTPLAISTSSGSPTIINTINDAHADVIALNSPAAVQNVLHRGLSVWGKKAGQVAFFAGGGTANTNFVGSISTVAGGTLTVTAMNSGTITVGQLLFGGGVDPRTVVTALGTGSGGTGTYLVSVSQTLGSTTMGALTGVSADCYFSFASSDDASILGAGYLGFETGLIGSPTSNVVVKNATMIGKGESFLPGSGFNGDVYCGFYDFVCESFDLSSVTLNGTALSGIATRTNSIVSGGDANCIALGSGTAETSIYMNPLGTTPYGFGGSGTQPNPTPLNGTILLEANGNTAGAYLPNGTRKT